MIGSYKKRQGQRPTHTQRTAQDTAVGGHLQAEERGLRRNQTGGQLPLGLPAFRAVRKEVVWSQPLGLWYWLLVLAN